ncbi:MAG: LemA family protein [Bacilli bacterium]|nr:LemA family protein [Bacilli bacterium]
MIYVLIVVALVVVYLLASYNGFVRLNNRVNEAFSTMDVYLKKRWDLIPNLVETVKGYAKHEEGTLAEIVKLRNGAYDSMDSDEKIKTNTELSKGITKIMALAESYPDLKANQNFLDLSSQLKSIEDDIANARKYYNGVVRKFNDKVLVFPNNIIAGMFGFKSKTMFEIASEERENVKVEF